MIFGVQPIEVISFFRQLGLAVSGAAALWGLVFYLKGHKETAQKILIHFFVWLMAGIVFWFVYLLLNIPRVSAHEGISLTILPDQFFRVQFLHFPLIAGMILISLIAIIWLKKNKLSFYNKLGWFYFLQFCLISIIIGLPVWKGIFDREQLFLMLHGWHSILTLGTVVAVDFLFLNPVGNNKNASRLFPLMSEMIWLGLGIDFAASFLIFKDALEMTDKFFFMQTVVGILILNGVMLSGPITRKILNQSIAPEFKKNMGLCGAISLVSWSSITLVDQFSDPTLKYTGYLFFYIIAIVLAFSAKLILDKRTKHANY